MGLTFAFRVVVSAVQPVTSAAERKRAVLTRRGLLSVLIASASSRPGAARLLRCPRRRKKCEPASAGLASSREPRPRQANGTRRPKGGGPAYDEGRPWARSRHVAGTDAVLIPFGRS